MYPTNSGTFRVQLRVGIVDGKQRLHSNNIESFELALWLYEVRLLHSDWPKSLCHLIKTGNYDVLVAIKACDSPRSYKNFLRYKVSFFATTFGSGRDIFKDKMGKGSFILTSDEQRTALQVLDNLKSCKNEGSCFNPLCPYILNHGLDQDKSIISGDYSHEPM